MDNEGKDDHYEDSGEDMDNEGEDDHYEDSGGRKISRKSGRSTLVNRRAVRITLDKAFRSDSVMLPNHTIIDPVSILSIILR